MRNNPQQPYPLSLHLCNSLDQATHYNDTPSEMQVYSQAEWSYLMWDDVLGDADLMSQVSQPDSKSMLVTVGLVLSLFCLSTITSVWQASRLTEAVVEVVENSVKDVVSLNHGYVVQELCPHVTPAQ